MATAVHATEKDAKATAAIGALDATVEPIRP
jgi:hypothetical protein